MADEKTYVHEGIEVRLTGRKAGKTLTSGRKDMLEEITPVSKYDGNWKKWARPVDLFEVDADVADE